MAGLSHHAKLSAGVVVEDYGELDLVFEVLLDGFDYADLAGEGDV